MPDGPVCYICCVRDIYCTCGLHGPREDGAMPDQRRIIDEEWEAKADGHGVAHIMSKVGSIAQFKGGFPHGVDLPRARIAALAPRMAKWVIEAQESGSTIEVEAHRLHGELIAADIREALQLEETPDTQDDHEEGQ